MPRIIAHVDMDAFFASVEQRDRPELRGKPVIVGGDRSSPRGVVSTCSYEARRYGVHSAMPIAQAVKLCPHGVYLTPDIGKYHSISQTIMGILLEFSPLVEPVSVDEAFIDLTGCMHFHSGMEDVGKKIKRRIKEETRLTASVGVSYNKFLAKLGSDSQKPDGLVIITEQDAEAFLSPLDISRIWGVGPKTAELLRHRGIFTVADVRKCSMEQLERVLGRQGRHVYMLCRGIDERPVEPAEEMKSISHETTFGEDICGADPVLTNLARLVVDVGRRLRASGMYARTVSIKIRYSEGFETITRSETLSSPFDDDDTIYECVRRLVGHIDTFRPIRLVGVGVSGLVDDKPMSLLDSESRDRLTEIMDRINSRYDRAVVYKGRILDRSSDTTRHARPKQV